MLLMSLRHNIQPFLCTAFTFADQSPYVSGGAEDERVIEGTSTPRIGTEVSMRSIKEKYYTGFPKKAKTIADRITDHCYAYFLQSPDVGVDGGDRDCP